MPTGSTISVEALVLVETSGERDLRHRTKYIGVLLTWRLLTSEAKLVMWLSMFKTRNCLFWREAPIARHSVGGATEKTPIWIGYM